MKLTSYWLDTSDPFRSATAGPVQGTCDVAVIGGGLTGSSAALALAKKGARVVLLEAETIGHAASGRNGGPGEVLPGVKLGPPTSRAFAATELRLRRFPRR